MRRGNPLIYSAAEAISASGSGRCRAAGRVARRMGASLSDAAGAHHRRLSAGRRARHRRAPDGSMAVGAARPAIHHREPARRRQQYRAPKRSCARRRTAIRSSWSVRRTRSTRRSTTSSISISSATSRRSPASCRVPLRHGGPSIGSGQDGSRVHRLCQGQSGQDQHGIRRHRDHRSCGRRAVQDDDRRRHGSRAVSRRRTRADRSARRTGASHVRHYARVDRAHQGRQASRAWR